MKNLLKFPALCMLLLASTSLTSCVASAGPAVVSAGPYYQSYYRPYPRPYYRHPGRVVVVEPAPLIVRPRPLIVAPRPYYYNYNVMPHRSYRVR